jgi:Nitrile hydratase, alpha chain
MFLLRFSAILSHEGFLAKLYIVISAPVIFGMLTLCISAFGKKGGDYMVWSQNTLQQQITARAMKDDAFRQELLANPKAVLHHELGMTLPPGVSIQVHEDTPTILHLVLPMKPPAGEPVGLSDAQLDEEAAGKDMHDPGTGGASR